MTYISGFSGWGVYTNLSFTDTKFVSVIFKKNKDFRFCFSWISFLSAHTLLPQFSTQPQLKKLVGPRGTTRKTVVAAPGNYHLFLSYTTHFPVRSGLQGTLKLLNCQPIVEKDKMFLYNHPEQWAGSFPGSWAFGVTGQVLVPAGRENRLWRSCFHKGCFL